MHPSPRLALLASLAILVTACSAAPASPPAASSGATAPNAPSPTPPSSDAPPTVPAGSSSPSPAAPSNEAPADALLAVALTDVRSGATFALGELAAEEGPVLLEPMAVWCSSCRAQQHEVKGAHEQGGFTSVSLDVDLSETPEDLASYADREGFDWRFAMADAALYRLLQDRFGVGVTNPPLTPLIVIERDGTVRALEFGRGVRNAEQLLAEIGSG
jgi:hypothetical protein